MPAQGSLGMGGSDGRCCVGWPIAPPGANTFGMGRPEPTKSRHINTRKLQKSTKDQQIENEAISRNKMHV